MKNISFLVFFLLVLLPISGYSKEFLRSYTYRAGEDDSRNSARVKAIEQAKLLLLEEIGIYIQSYIEIDKYDSNTGTSVFLTHEIRTTTAGITKTEVLTEAWNGEEYVLKVRIVVDVEDVVEKINDTLEARGSSQNISTLNRLIEEKDIEISELSSALAMKKEESRNRQIKISQMSNELALFKLKVNEQVQEERRLQNKLGKIQIRIKNATNNVDMLALGMTESEVVKIAGKPSARDACPTTGDVFLNYGEKWAHLVNGIYKSNIPISKFTGACDASLGF